MNGLYSKAWEHYFYTLRHGIVAWLPVHRQHNRDLLLAIDDALHTQTHLSRFDEQHLGTWKTLADTVTIPTFDDVKSACDMEAYLLTNCPQVPPHDVIYATRWLIHLFAKTGRIQANLAHLNQEIKLWRRVNRVDPLKQGVYVALLHWMKARLFSLTDQIMTVRYAQHLAHWMERKGLSALEHITDMELHRFLLDRYAHTQRSSQQRIMGSLKPLFQFYKDEVNPFFVIPHHSVIVPRCLGSETATPEAILNAIETHLTASTWNADTRLMLTLILRHSVPLKALPLMTVMDSEQGLLQWERQRPNRLGIETRTIQLELSAPWIADLWSETTQAHSKQQVDYLFTTRRSQRSGRPVHSDYIQRNIQKTIQATLGYDVTVSQLVRGVLKRQARAQPLDAFMTATQPHPFTKRTRLMVWLAHHKT